MPYEFDWKEYVTFAQQLLDAAESDEDSVRFRTCVSRAYYGAFCVCRREIGLEDHEINEPIHDFVVKHYSGLHDKNLKKVGRDLGDLKRLRVQADYKGQVMVGERKASTSLVLANRIIANFP